MSKHSEVFALCDTLAAEAHQPSLREAFKIAAAALRELEAERDRLREALTEIASEDTIDIDGLWERRPALADIEMWQIARAALEGKG